MENDQIEYINHHVHLLVPRIECTPVVLNYLLHKKVLHEYEAQSIKSMKTPYEKSSELLNLMKTKLRGYEDLLECLHTHCQSGAADILRKLKSVPESEMHSKVEGDQQHRCYDGELVIRSRQQNVEAADNIKTISSQGQIFSKLSTVTTLAETHTAPCEATVSKQSCCDIISGKLAYNESNETNVEINNNTKKISVIENENGTFGERLDIKSPGSRSIIRCNSNADIESLEDVSNKCTEAKALIQQQMNVPEENTYKQTNLLQTSGTSEKSKQTGEYKSASSHWKKSQ